MLQVVRRWPGVILSVVLVTLLVLGVRLFTSPRVFESQVKLQLTLPQQEDVALYDRYRTSSVHDDMTVARNNFVEVLQSREVHDRTVEQLRLGLPDAAYTIDVQPLRDSDFIYVAARAATPSAAQVIANAHVAAAIDYYGELRAKPATATREFIAAQLAGAEQDLSLAEQAFTEFKMKHNIGTLDNELSTYRELIQQLQEERSRRMIEGPTSLDIQATQRRIEQLQVSRETALAQGNTQLAQGFDQAIARNEAQLADLIKNTSATAHIDEIIAARQRDLAALVGYGAQYNDLEQKVTQAQAKYDLLQNKLTEAVLKENDVKTSSFLQVVEPAVAPLRPAPTNAKVLLILALFGSAGVGLMLAFLLDYLAGQLAGRTLLPTELIIRPAPQAVARNGKHPPGAPVLNGAHAKSARKLVRGRPRRPS
jgi:uncharacterized protein involved in exopolysaccharide biosynthesis